MTLHTHVCLLHSISGPVSTSGLQVERMNRRLSRAAAASICRESQRSATFAYQPQVKVLCTTGHLEVVQVVEMTPPSYDKVYCKHPSKEPWLFAFLLVLAAFYLKVTERDMAGLAKAEIRKKASNTEYL